MVQASRPHNQRTTPQASASKPCCHWYDFPAPTGPQITGVCRHCGKRLTVPAAGMVREDPRVRSKFRSENSPTMILPRAIQEDDVERMRQAKQQANSAIAW